MLIGTPHLDGSGVTLATPMVNMPSVFASSDDRLNVALETRLGVAAPTIWRVLAIQQRRFLNLYVHKWYAT